MIDYSSPMTEAFLRTGKCPGVPIIDMHAHMFNCYECPMLVDTTEKQVAAMDACGVELAVFVSHDSLYGGYSYYQGDLDAARAYPGRFLMYATVFPGDLDPRRDLAFCDAHREVAGLKVHGDTNGVPISDPMHEPYYDYADERKLPVLFHTWGGSPQNGIEQAQRVLDRHHDFTFIAGHSFRGQFDRAIRLAHDYPNLVLELTAVLSQQGSVEAFVAAGLEDRIVFGVDMPWFAYSFGIGALLSANISDEVREKILYKNALRILKRADAALPEKFKSL